MLEPAEGQSALVEVLLAFGGVQAETANKIVHPPEFVAIVPKIEQTIVGGNEMQRHPGVLNPITQEVGDGAGVDHQLNGIFENVFIDTLQDVFAAGVRYDLDGVIDVTAAEFLAADGVAINIKRRSDLLNLHEFSPHKIAPALQAQWHI
jgi:hypothetical protein